MKDKLESLITQYGFSGVLDVLGDIAEEKEKAHIEDVRTKKQYERAKYKLWFLSKKKFIKGL